MALAIATFNVKDLLEPSDPRDREALPAKLDWIAGCIRRCDADVVGLQEVGPAPLVDALASRLQGCGYAARVVGTADARGIRCALISRARILSARVHTAAALTFPLFCESDPQPFGTRIPLRRGVIHAQVDAPSIGPVDVFVAHFKSSRPVPVRRATSAEAPAEVGIELPAETPRERAEGTVRSSVWRVAEALFVRDRVDAVLARDAAAHVAVIGDLNDLPDSLALRTLRAEGPGQLMDCTTGVAPASRYSTLHGGDRVQIDHVLSTCNLYSRLESATFFNEELREHQPVEAGRDQRLTIDSDHAPLVVRFRA